MIASMKIAMLRNIRLTLSLERMEVILMSLWICSKYF